MHPAKRRKLHQPCGFQNKPFRSPLRSANPQPQPSVEQAQIHLPAAGLSSSPHQSSPDIKPDIVRLSLPRASGLRSSSRLTAVDPESRDLQKQHTALSFRLNQLRQSLEIAEEALQIEASKQDDELRALIARWRTVAQDAAEELFADAKERIDRMGGVAHWRRQLEEDSRLWKGEREKEALIRRYAGNLKDDQNQRETEEPDQAELMNYQEDAEPEEKYFTMEMMLNQMNINLQSVGFDKHQERWI
ncbi:uncharacterized protein A1O5_05678 [Cladophialophora psammophila CBS 110553]|uniref:DNA repair protein Dds20/Mei5 n=1 Tax=Cladophialophora psammophila CBS 110553 TaxID=1182543 RepID=W9WRX7_9EURO|nr:uncharacterized protein A1O5_05678 [Cladophialophora psammophila CBS 110553]EXJ70688.1 hypothetical protein A1O5_05678 [Cladophialophora psammophila CBS 110553]